MKKRELGLTRKAAIDFDILQYEVGFAAEAYWRHLHNDNGLEVEHPPPFSIVEEMLESRTDHILAVSGSDSSPIMCVTGDNNFRHNIATSSPYKDRASHKPYHHKNILAYAMCRWDVRREEGFEADDLLAMLLTEDENIICCSRDKDLLQVNGWHFQWENNKQPQFGPFLVEGYGELILSEDGKKLKGWGDKFFLSQLLTGDRVDTIPGLPSYGPVAAFKTLAHTNTYPEGLEAVREAYRASERDDEYLLEQGQLLWMIREKDRMGNPVMWGFK